MGSKNKNDHFNISELLLASSTKFQKELYGSDDFNIWTTNPVVDLANQTVPDYMKRFPKSSELVVDLYNRIMEMMDKNKFFKTKSTFRRSLKRQTWGIRSLCQIDSSNKDDDGSVHYNPNTSFHFMKYVYLEVPLPRLEVLDEFKDTVRIAWQHNVGNILVKDAILKKGNDTLQNIDGGFCDHAFNFLREPGTEDTLAQDIGSIRSLEEFGSVLPEHPLTPQQPWLFSIGGDRNAIPISFCSKDSFYFKYNYRLKISELLRVEMREKADGTYGDWNELNQKVKNELILSDYITGLPQSGKLSVPKLYAKYSEQNEKEKKLHSFNTEGKYYMLDVIPFQAANPSTYGDTVSLEINTTSPVQAVFWNARNQVSVDYGNVSNCTTNSKNPYEGWNPCSENSLYFGTIEIFSEMGHVHFTRKTGLNDFKSPPVEQGYLAYTFTADHIGNPADLSLDPSPEEKKSGVTMKLVVKIANNFIDKSSTMDAKKAINITKNITDILAKNRQLTDNKDKEEIAMKDSFKLEARVIIIKEIRMDKNPETGMIESFFIKNYKKIEE